MRASFVCVFFVFAGCVPDAVRDVDLDDKDDVVVDACDGIDVDSVFAAFDAERDRKGIPAVGVALVKGDCVVGRGLGEGVDAHTRFNIASMTKTLTALTALSLEEDGVVDRDAPVADHVATTSTATLEQMLAHRGGYPVDVGPDDALDLDGSFAAASSKPMWADPDEVWLYSNAGFALTGLALENAAATPFADLVSDRVFAKAGMVDAVMGANVDDDDLATIAAGHSGDPAHSDVVSPLDPYLTSTYYGPMGGVFASADDMAHLMKALVDDGGDVVSKASLDDMAVSRGAAYGSAVGYGQGLFVVFDGTVFHSGSVFGYLSEFDVDRDDDFGIAVLSAADWDMPADALYETLAQFTTPPAGGPPPDEEWSNDDLAGVYVDDDLGDVVVSVDDGGVHVVVADHDVDGDADCYAPTACMLAWPEFGADLEITFQQGPSGARYFVSPAGVAEKR